MATALLGFVMVSGICFLHTPLGQSLPWGRRILSLMGVVCPVTQVSPKVVSELRAIGVSALQGQILAPTRPSFQLPLDLANESDVSQEMLRRGAHCRKEQMGFHFLICKAVAASALGLDENSHFNEIAFAFGESGKLFDINLYRSHLSISDGARFLRARLKTLEPELGAPSRMVGADSTDALAAPMATTMFEYRFKNYYAKITATHMPTGITLYEHYTSLSPAFKN